MSEEREREILGFLCDGISNKEIASCLFVTENTIKLHLKKVFAKLDVRSRSQAIHTARALRLVKQGFGQGGLCVTLSIN